MTEVAAKERPSCLISAPESPLSSITAYSGQRDALERRGHDVALVALAGATVKAIGIPSGGRQGVAARSGGRCPGSGPGRPLPELKRLECADDLRLIGGREPRA